MDKDNNRGMRDWLIFIRTAEAARQLDISTATVSKAVSRFELYLDAVLFTRTPKGHDSFSDGSFTYAVAASDSNKVDYNVWSTSPAKAGRYTINTVASVYNP